MYGQEPLHTADTRVVLALWRQGSDAPFGLHTHSKELAEHVIPDGILSTVVLAQLKVTMEAVNPLRRGRTVSATTACD